MLFVHNSALTIYFGNAKDSLYPHEYLNLSKDRNILERELFVKLQKSLNINRLIFLKQIHSIDGFIITNDHISMSSFSHEGDFSITNIAHIGLGVMTADCLPLIISDPVHNVVAIIHAGWKGTINNIVIRVVKEMQKLFNTHLDTIYIIFGPSAKKCCYEVNKDFVSWIKNNPLIDTKRVLHQQNNKLFFDLPGFNQLLLETIGIKKNAFCFDYNVCTICNNQFFSHRRQGNQAGRQMTVIGLQQK